MRGSSPLLLADIPFSRLERAGPDVVRVALAMAKFAIRGGKPNVQQPTGRSEKTLTLQENGRLAG